MPEVAEGPAAPPVDPGIEGAIDHPGRIAGFRVPRAEFHSEGDGSSAVDGPQAIGLADDG